MRWILSTFLLLLCSFTVEASELKTSAKYAAVLEVETGKILYAKKAEERMPTSSMSKIMTMYLVFEALEKGALKLDQKVKVSKKAWQQKGSRMFLRQGQRVKVEDLIRGVIVQSGNDASIVLSEAVAGSEASFAAMMNDKSRELGMKDSHFMNASGLPDNKHYSTARDLVFLTFALMRDFPQYYHYYSEKSFTFNKIKQGNRNPLLYRSMGVDGVKTGHTDAAGYGLLASALREGRRVISLVNGLSSMQKRANESAKLLNWAYREYDNYRLVKKDEVVGAAPVWLGVKKEVPVVAVGDITMTLLRDERGKVRTEILVVKEIEAPVHKGQELGKAVVIGSNLEPVEVKLVAREDVARLGFFGTAVARVKRILGGGGG